MNSDRSKLHIISAAIPAAAYDVDFYIKSAPPHNDAQPCIWHIWASLMI